MGAVTAPACRSRFQVLTDGSAAWTDDVSGTLYRFDGFCFSRRRRRDASFTIVPSWMTPPHGWMLLAACPCAVWIVEPDESTSRSDPVPQRFVA
jgi:hypothetical protein